MQDMDDDLYRVAEATNPDGSVDVHIESWEKVEWNHDEDEIRVEFTTPTGNTESEKMPFPKIDDDSYKFVRLVESIGLDLKSAGALNSGEYTARANPESWRLITRRKSANRMRVEGALNTVASVFLPRRFAIGLFGMALVPLSAGVKFGLGLTVASSVVFWFGVIAAVVAIAADGVVDANERSRNYNGRY